MVTVFNDVIKQVAVFVPLIKKVALERQKRDFYDRACLALLAKGEAPDKAHEHAWAAMANRAKAWESYYQMVDSEIEDFISNMIEADRVAQAQVQMDLHDNGVA